MHIRLTFLILGVAGACMVPAQQTLDLPQPVDAAVHMTAEELEELLAPVALHPDALIALVLPAATNPADVVLAARRLAVDPNPDTLEAEPWDDSVLALARYPEMLQWMDENLDWTKQVGEAFLAQPADVMNAIQRLRERARANGTLVDTPQQEVVVVEEQIRIIPARTDVIYVPRYDPAIVYVPRPYAYPISFMTFSVGYPVGYWLAYDFDWPRRTFWIVPPPQRVRYWHEQRDWRHPIHVTVRTGFRDHRWHAWRPRPAPVRPVSFVSRREVASPQRSAGFVQSSRPSQWSQNSTRPSRVSEPTRHGQTASVRSAPAPAFPLRQETRPSHVVGSSTERERLKASVVPRTSSSTVQQRAQSAPRVSPVPGRSLGQAGEVRTRPSSGQWSQDSRTSVSSAAVAPPSHSGDRSREEARNRRGAGGGGEGHRSFSPRSASESRGHFRGVAPRDGAGPGRGQPGRSRRQAD